MPRVKIDGLVLTVDMAAPSGDAAPDAHPDHTTHMAHGAGGDHQMPGMLTQEQLEELAASFGPEFDRLFLTYMIGHHAGAVTMVDELLAGALPAAVAAAAVAEGFATRRP